MSALSRLLDRFGASLGMIDDNNGVHRSSPCQALVSLTGCLLALGLSTMCGVLGLALGHSSANAFPEILEALLQLQHRGQDGCGITTGDLNGPVHAWKGQGLLNDVFLGNSSKSPKVDNLPGPMGLGHVRYRTAGSMTDGQLQPLTASNDLKLSLVHNGHIFGTRDGEGHHQRLVARESVSDSKWMLLGMTKSIRKSRIRQPGLDDIEVVSKAIHEVMNTARGSFACVLTLGNGLMIGFRDPWGIKPLVYGVRTNSNGSIDTMFSSESVCLEMLGFSCIRDVLPGAAVIHDGRNRRTILHHQQVIQPISYTPDIFEFVYFARPDSEMDGMEVHECRRQIGKALGRTMREQIAGCLQEITHVIPVPDTAYVSAIAAAEELGLPCSPGLVKNRYSTRTFIAAGQEHRRRAITRKLHAVKSTFDGHSVIIIDDSIVRGGTSRQIVALARKAGAKKIIFASASPAIRHNHIHGIDLAEPKQLIATSRTDAEVAYAIGADAVVYLSVQDLVASCFAAMKTHAVKGFETGVFTGSYVTDMPLAQRILPQATKEKQEMRTSSPAIIEVSS